MWFGPKGGSVSTAIYVAVSVRVGTLLGENKPDNARYVAKLGMILASGAGALISLLIYLFRCVSLARTAAHRHPLSGSRSRST